MIKCTSKFFHLLKYSLLFILILCALSILILTVFFKAYKDPWGKRVSNSGYISKNALINKVNFSYVEGPDNGYPLVLLHAQHMDWFSYSRVLPELSKHFHIFDIDYPGHGTTTYPNNYLMNASQIGNDLGDFIKRIIGEPAFITGNSSGGLLTAWLAAYRPEAVKAILLEDPPLFSAEYPRIKQTIAYRSFTTCYKFVEDNESDFLIYWIRSNSKFFDNNVFKGSSNILINAVYYYRFLNPHIPVEIGLIPNDTIRLFLRGLDQYDAKFGAAFYDGTWNKGFNHTEALSRIRRPVLLLHANFKILNDGTLDGAMSNDDANNAISLLSNGRYLRIDALHVVHLDKPDSFIKILEDFFLQIR